MLPDDGVDSQTYDGGVESTVIAKARQHPEIPSLPQNRLLNDGLVNR